MKNNKKNTSPLSEKFDKAEMPFEPDAWAQMTALLADNPKKKRSFGRSSFFLFLAFLMGITLLGSWFFTFKNNEPLRANTSFNLDKKQAVDATHSELYNSKISEQNLIENAENSTRNLTGKTEITTQNLTVKIKLLFKIQIGKPKSLSKI